MPNKIFLSFMLLFSPMTQAADELAQLQVLKSMISPQQIDIIIQKFQPQMKPEQRSQLSNIVQQQINNLSQQEAAPLANTKMIDMPDLVKKHISNIPPAEMQRIKQALK